ncbi:PREDICTED: ankyrin repeat-containing protein At2g01680-like [Tarenaya hassleriana]|uniref:ankyrin repeat-containing protein At2g01680-like n=1 Tax=Tarenaya hassleriana TaxID=28532 RepID=UPI00053C1732|nr:PREDICTED: ankyrin repeat-containing protein At2g01680-like [Tarenaya hassleriana]
MDNNDTLPRLNTTAAQNETISERYMSIAQEGDVDKFHALVAADKNVPDALDGFDRGLYDTPMHAAAQCGHTYLALEIMNIKPSFARKLNASGFSPMHLALQNNHSHTVRALVTEDRGLVGIRGRGMITPLHHVAMTGNEDLLDEFLVACPSAIERRTSKRETAVHIAVKHAKLGAFKILVGWLKRVNREEVLNWKDEDGNTILHIATSTNQTEVVKLIYKVVNVNAKNLEGRTAKDIFISNEASLAPEIGRLLVAARAKEGHEVTGSESETTWANYLRRLLHF